MTKEPAMIFESHAHYDDEAFDEDREELLGAMRAHGVEYIINSSASVRGLHGTVKLMERYPFIYGAVGLHPDEVGDMTADLMEEIRVLCRHEKTAAVGEIGLDYYWDKERHELQKKWFEAQMELAREEKLPFIVHSRDAAADTLDMVKALHGGDIGGVIHCFSYSKETAREYLDMGLYLGVGGVITFKNARKLKEVVEYAPLASLLLETDCPYLAPVPYRGKRNHSLYLTYVAQAIAELKNVSYEEVVAATNENAKTLFTRVK